MIYIIMMKNKFLSVFVVLLITCGISAFGQKSLCINEVMVNNKTDVIDDYGLHQPWIEIFNTAFASADIKSCYLTNDRRVLDRGLSVTQRTKMMYPIPRGDERTKMGPRQYLIFWADGFPKRGNFHLNFQLDSIKPNWIALYDANGYTLIDSVTVPVLKANCSYGLIEDGILSKGWEVKGLIENDGKIHKFVTPNTNNLTLDSNAKVTKFKEHDPDGISMTIVAMGVVFFALILLYIAFKITGKIGADLTRKNAMKARGITDKTEAIQKSIGHESGDIFAAIGMALHEYQNNVHDNEDLQLTMQKVKRNYSPWSSKIYMLRHTPRR